MSRPKLNALPQDSVLHAHLRRQADWPDDASRLVRSDPSRQKVRDLNNAVERIGRANRLRAEADALRSSAERAGCTMQPEVAMEIERLEREAAALVGQAHATDDGPGMSAASSGDGGGNRSDGSRRSRFRRRGRPRSGRP